MFKVVKKAIDEFNPYSLLPEALNDQFDIESMEIAEKIDVNSTVEEITEIISKVFSRAFGESFEIKNCMTTSEKIYTSIGLNNNLK